MKRPLDPSDQGLREFVRWPRWPLPSTAGERWIRSIVVMVTCCFGHRHVARGGCW